MILNTLERLEAHPKREEIQQELEARVLEEWGDLSLLIKQGDDLAVQRAYDWSILELNNIMEERWDN